jgi:hypothetical protein
MTSTQLSLACTRANLDDLHTSADTYSLPHRRADPRRARPTGRWVTVRFGSPADQGRLARLAALDSSKPPTDPVLLAEVDGQLLAALAISNDAVIADPFHLTADLISLLRARAAQLDTNRRVGRLARLRSWARAWPRAVASKDVRRCPS